MFKTKFRIAMTAFRSFENLGFEFVSDLGFRAWDFI